MAIKLTIAAFILAISGGLLLDYARLEYTGATLLIFAGVLILGAAVRIFTIEDNKKR